MKKVLVIIALFAIILTIASCTKEPNNVSREPWRFSNGEPSFVDYAGKGRVTGSASLYVVFADTPDVLDIVWGNPYGQPFDQGYFYGESRQTTAGLSASVVTQLQNRFSLGKKYVVLEDAFWVQGPDAWSVTSY